MYSDMLLHFSFCGCLVGALSVGNFPPSMDIRVMRAKFLQIVELMLTIIILIQLLCRMVISHMAVEGHP